MTSNPQLNCIFCNSPITKRNKTEEHIIPENIGGKLKSKKIICSKCNNQFGRQLDDALLEKFLVIDTYLNLKKKRKKSKKLKGTYKGKTYILPSSGPPERIPEQIENEKTEKQYIFTSEESAGYYLKKYAKRQEKIGKIIDIEKTIQNAKREKISFEEPIMVVADGDSDKIWRCCAKIVYEFLFFLKRDYKPSSAKFNDLIQGKLDIKDYPICLGNINYIPINRDPDHLYHTIIIEGRKEEKILIGYLEIYGAFYVVMVLDEKYEGEDFIIGYCHDLIENKYGCINPNSFLPIETQVLKDLINHCSETNILYDLQSQLLHSTTNIAFLKARYYPIKSLLLNLSKLIKNEKFSSKIASLKKCMKNIEELLNKHGINIDDAKKIRDNDERSELIKKIIKLLEISRCTLYYIGLDENFIKDLIVYFNKLHL